MPGPLNEAERKKTTGLSGVSSQSVLCFHSMRLHVLEWRTHTRSAHLNLESSQSLFVLVYSAVEGKVCLSQMAQLLADQSCLGIRGYLCLIHKQWQCPACSVWTGPIDHHQPQGMTLSITKEMLLCRAQDVEATSRVHKTAHLIH